MGTSGGIRAGGRRLLFNLSFFTLIISPLSLFTAETITILGGVLAGAGDSVEIRFWSYFYTLVPTAILGCQQIIREYRQDLQPSEEGF